MIAKLISSVPNSPDHINFKIKPLNAIFAVQQKKEEPKKGTYPPPVFPKIEER